jgi:hypothetical protein
MTRARDLANIGPGVPTGFRNVIHNGDMRIKQRASFTTTTNAHQFTTDRWWVFSGVSTVGEPSYITSTGLTNFPNALRAQRQASNTGTAAVAIGQTIESADVHQLKGKTVTVSFWARAGANFSSASSALNVFLTQGTGVDQGTSAVITQTWTGFSNTTIGTATLTTSWQKFTYTSTVSSATNEMAVQIYYVPVGTAGANDYFDLTGVQLEQGAIATPFEQRPYGLEFELCRRHFLSGGTQYGPATSFGLGNSYHGTVSFPIAMRAVPAITVFSSSGSANQATWYPGSVIANVGVEAITVQTFVLLQPGNPNFNGALYTYIANAEL